jgi:hypothetical protein
LDIQRLVVQGRFRGNAGLRARPTRHADGSVVKISLIVGPNRFKSHMRLCALAAAITAFYLITAVYLLIVNRNRVVRPRPLMLLTFWGI